MPYDRCIRSQGPYTGVGNCHRDDRDLGRGHRRRISAWRGHSSTVKSLAFSPDGRVLATGGDDAAIRVWEVPKADDVLKHTNQALHVRKPS